MKISTSTSRSFLLAAFCLSFLLVSAPAQASTSVKITDVMYDPSGADQGHEWIQITNEGAPINIGGYRLYEGGTNHKLFVAVGTSTLAANEVAILTTDPAQYQADHPSFSGTIFKSSFSLSNTGETIELRDTKLATVDTYSYIAPPVVKAPVPVKVSKATSYKSVASNGKTTSYSYAAGEGQAAAVPLAALPKIPDTWMFGLGLASLLVLGAATFLYAQPQKLAVTTGGAEEFEIVE